MRTNEKCLANAFGVRASACMTIGGHGGVDERKYPGGWACGVDRRGSLVVHWLPVCDVSETAVPRRACAFAAGRMPSLACQLGMVFV